jgi:hypothetical protein
MKPEPNCPGDPWREARFTVAVPEARFSTVPLISPVFNVGSGAMAAADASCVNVKQAKRDATFILFIYNRLNVEISYGCEAIFNWSADVTRPRKDKFSCMNC